ncbi:MAG: EmrA/EmrK family multidrug efflux transporter periplasmic adaptor subunit, partial [Proteobacteria bacterium]|nr:EmrA/EmrK family multidrug efflux transporter periplasmic adaptor subunit [Pseudomonadota bacterium]
MYDSDDVPSETAAATAAPAAPEPRPAIAPANRGRLFALLGGTVAIAAIAVGGWALIEGGRHVKTENAYVDAASAQVTPLIAAAVTAAPVINTQAVKAGQPLVVLDDADARLALA